MDFNKTIDTLERLESTYFLNGKKYEAHKVDIVIDLLIQAISEYESEKTSKNALRLFLTMQLCKDLL